jgi:DNA-binding HxlR family transcriptional regulator
MQTETTLYLRRISHVVSLLQRKWTTQILVAMCDRPVRLSQLKRAIPIASKKALTARLRSLQAAEVITRRDLSATILHVEYEFTVEMKQQTIDLLDHLAAWGESFEAKQASKNRRKY